MENTKYTVFPKFYDNCFSHFNISERVILQFTCFKYFLSFFSPKSNYIDMSPNCVILVASLFLLPSPQLPCLHLWLLMDSIAWWSRVQTLEQVISVQVPAPPLISC